MSPEDHTTEEPAKEEGGTKFEITMPRMVGQQRETPNRTTFPHQDVQWKQMVLVLQRNRR